MKKLLVVACLFIAHAAFGQNFSEGEKEILTLQDQRSLGNGKLVAYLSNPDEQLRYRAAIALANLQDTATVDVLLPVLRDHSPRVRSAVAFALGQIGSVRAEDSLVSALKRETSAETFGRIAEALGKCGTEEALFTLVEHKLDSKLESARGQLVLAVSRFALRQIKTERAVWFCFDQLANNDATVRWSALFALWRTAPLRVIDIELAKREAELQKLVNDPSPDVRMQFATLLGRVKVDESTGLLKQLSTAESKRNEWRVQVNILRSLGARVAEVPDLLPDVLAYLASGNDHVAVTALQVIATLSPGMISGYSEKDKLEADLVSLANAQNKADMVRGEALVVLGRHFPDKVNADLLTKAESSPRLKSKVIEAVSFKPSVENFRLLTEYLEGDSVRVAMAAWDFFRRVSSPFAIAEYMKQDTTLKNVQQVLYGKIRSALNRNDMAITTLVANAVGDTTFFVFFRGTEFEEQVREQLVAAYQRLSSPDDTETMQAVLDALGKIGNQTHVPVLEKALQDPDRTVAVYAAGALQRITGKDYSNQVPQSTKPMFTDYDWETLDELSDESRLVLETSKGTVTLALLKDHAPFTVLNIVKLARKGFYNGLNFHRVVPNFVIQGGDPRGDGWGGPGYAIRSEFSLVNYERGMAGIASAGKDTEGCQFFVVHSPQPHLDGRYTIFAKVLEGMDVIDNIQVGDNILNVEVED